MARKKATPAPTPRKSTARPSTAPPEPIPEPEPVELDLRAEPLTEPLTQSTKRFDIFLIDTGWNRQVSEVVRTHLPLLYEYHKQDSLYLLTRQQSVEVLKHDPALIGHDPIIIFYDRFLCPPGAGAYHGFRLCLGLMRHAGQALARLQECVKFVAANRACERFDLRIRRELHREGVDGIIKVLRDTTSELIVE